MVWRSRVMLLIPFAIVASSCASDPMDPTRVEVQQAPPPIFAAIEITPNPLEMDQGAEVPITVVALDQYRNRLPSSGIASFSTDAPAIATVDRYGFIRGLAPGTAEISATMTIGGITKTAAVKTTVSDTVAMPAVILTTDGYKWTPNSTHLAVGGTVTWRAAYPLQFTKVYLMDNNYRITEEMDMSGGFVIRKFDKPGIYRYCGGGCWDPPDFGVIYVQ